MCIYDKVYDGTDTLTLPPFEIFGFATVPDARPQKFGAACGVHLCMRQSGVCIVAEKGDNIVFQGGKGVPKIV